MQKSPPTLFILSGLPASGKSTLSKYIAKRYNAIYLRIDTIEQGLRDICNVSGEEGEGYRLAYKIANDNLTLGIHVVADSCNTTPLSRKAWEAVAQSIGCSFINIEVLCSDKKEHKKRSETRKAEIKNLIAPDWNAIENREYYPWSSERISIDTAGKSIEETEDELHSKIREFLASEKASIH